MSRAPAFVHNAVEAGSGKTKLFDTVSLIALGTSAPLLNADILEDETELKKVLTTLTRAATPFAVLGVMHLTHLTHDVESPRQASADDMEITNEMIEAGLKAIYGFDVTEPSEAEMKEAVRAVFIAMMKARP